MNGTSLFLQDLGITREMLFAAAVVLAASIVTLSVSWYRQRKKYREKEQYALRQMREEAFDRALANPPGEEPEPFEKTRRPFGVEYSQGDSSQESGIVQGIMYQLAEFTELSQRTYIGKEFGNGSSIHRIGPEGRVDDNLEMNSFITALEEGYEDRDWYR